MGVNKMSSDEEVVKNVTFEDSDSEDEGDESGSRKIYNAQAMLQKLDEIKRDDNIPWIEFPVINSGLYMITLQEKFLFINKWLLDVQKHVLEWKCWVLNTR